MAEALTESPPAASPRGDFQSHSRPPPGREDALGDHLLPESPDTIDAVS